MLRSLTFFCAAFLCVAAGADERHPYIAGGYQEAVFSVSNIERDVEFYEKVAGWEVLYRGATPKGLLRAYDLDDDVSAREAVLGNPGTERGFVRLIDFDGAEQVQVRSNAQSWDTGGIFDVNTRVADMERKFAEFQAHGWQAASDPVEFSFGPFVVSEWLARGPDGIVIAMIERIAPPLQGWPHMKEVSRLFNATHIVGDAEAARDFYIDKLGFRMYLEHVAASEVPEQNVLGLPHNMATEVPRAVYIVHPEGTNEGSIEVLGFDGAVGRDFSERADPPNLGILSLRFPLRDLDGFVRHLEREGIEIVIPPTPITMPPYGEVTVLSIRAPGRVRLEFYARH